MVTNAHEWPDGRDRVADGGTLGYKTEGRKNRLQKRGRGRRTEGAARARILYKDSVSCQRRRDRAWGEWEIDSGGEVHSAQGREEAGGGKSALSMARQKRGAGRAGKTIVVMLQMWR